MVYSGAKRAYSQDKIIIQIMSNAILFYDLFLSVSLLDIAFQ